MKWAFVSAFCHRGSDGDGVFNAAKDTFRTHFIEAPP
jgi:hypothetical protein